VGPLKGLIPSLEIVVRQLVGLNNKPRPLPPSRHFSSSFPIFELFLGSVDTSTSSYVLTGKMGSNLGKPYMDG